MVSSAMHTFFLILSQILIDFHLRTFSWGFMWFLFCVDVTFNCTYCVVLRTFFGNGTYDDFLVTFVKRDLNYLLVE